ncbi:hypothetical protein IJ847_00335 [Candidatus Saccharibacteria bacterium]|nr:hypothetical protein [Candidatus Saccharibacteria bacterium]
MERRTYSEAEVIRLAALAAADYAASCSGPTIRGRNGEKNLRGKSVEAVAEANGMTVEQVTPLVIDLAAAGWDDLSDHWQQVNVQSAHGMIEIMEKLGGPDVVSAVNLNDPAQRLRYGTLLHQAWLDQNAWAADDPVLSRDFADLPVGEQDKDIQQLKSLQAWLSEIG